MSLQEIPYKHLDTQMFHDNTTVSKANRAVENNLLKSLQSVTKAIVNDTKQHNQARWTYIFGILRPRLEQLVHDYVRESVTKSYTLGAEYAVNAVDRRLPFYLTESDINNIKSLTAQYVDKYWNRIQTSFSSKIIQENPDKVLNPAYVDEPISISLSTESLALGTQSKAYSLLLDRRFPVGGIVQSAPTPQRITPSLLQGRAETISTVKGFLDRQRETTQAVQEGLPAMQFIWITANNACKNFCDPIRGVTWYVGQPFPYYPPRHPNCRCRLFLIRVST